MKKVWISLLSCYLIFSSCNPLTPLQPNVAAGGRAVAVSKHPHNDNEFFVASEGGGIFKSTDAGINWAQVSGSTTFGFNDVKYCVADPTIIIAAANNDTKTTTGGGIWRSTNSGAAWTHITITGSSASCASSISAYAIAIEPGNNKIWAGTTCGLAVSTNNGASFHLIGTSTNFHNETVYAVLAPAANQLKILTDDGVKVSTNDGSGWTFSTTGLPYVIKGQHAQIACSPLNHRHIFWASNFTPYDGKWHNGMYYSSDNGNTWTNLIDNFGINRPPTCYTARALSGMSNKFDLYFSDGGCTLQRASFTNATPPVISGSWAALTTPHCDYADLCFKSDGQSPALLLGDGGIFSTADNGAHWAFTGGGSHGYNALQITEVTGQLHSSDQNSDLYYATQDNNISSSPDGGLTWPASGTFCCEGFYLNIPRQSLPPADTRFTGVACGPCGNFVTGPLALGYGGFSNVANSTNAPRLLRPGAYIQSDTLPGAPTVSLFSLTTNNGGSWVPKYGFVNQQEDLSKTAGPSADPVVFSAVQIPGATSDGQEIVGIKKIVDVLGAGSPIVSDVGGVGGIGTFPTMFAWYKPFGPDIHNVNHLIVPDITTDKVRTSSDGGLTWTDDNALTNLVTQAGVFHFRSGAFTQISSIAFDPDVPGRILVGTVQAGIFSTCDGGGSWNKIANTETVPNVSSFYFAGDNKVIVSSYGRGLWKLYLPACPTLVFHHPILETEEPLIYWMGAYVPISQIHNPDVCPVCGYFIMSQGDIAEVHVSPSNEVTGVAIRGGTLKGFTYDSQPLGISFNVSASDKNYNAARDQPLADLLARNYKVKGIFMEGKLFKGLMLAKKDILPSQLPQKQEIKSFLKSDVIRDPLTGSVTGVRLIAKGLEKDKEVNIFVDGKRADVSNMKREFDREGHAIFQLNYYLFAPGGHTVLLEQKTENGSFRQATTIIIPLSGDSDRERK